MYAIAYTTQKLFSPPAGEDFSAYTLCTTWRRHWSLPGTLIHSFRPKEVSQSEIKISIIIFWLGLLVRPSIHFYTKMSIFNVNLRFKYLTVLKSDFRLENSAKSNEWKYYFKYFTTSQVFNEIWEQIAAFLDTHLLFVWDAGTKQLIGCKWVIGTVD